MARFKVSNLAKDYPAAHSMDTYWFAVDELGEVAIFDSSENGVVPNVSDCQFIQFAIAEAIGPYDVLLHSAKREPIYYDLCDLIDGNLC